MTTPKHWEISPLGKIVEVLDNLRVPVNSSERNKRPGSIPYYGATGQVGTIDEALFNEELLILGEDGVQFFDPNKPKAYKISGPAWVNNHAHVLRPKPEKVLQNFLLHFLNQFNYVGYANGTTRLKLTQGAMNSIPVHLPPLPEQQKIVEILEDHLSRLDAALADVKQAKLKAAQFRRSLLQAAFTGNLSGDGTRLMTELPPNWKVSKIGDVAEVIRGVTYSKSDTLSENDIKSVPLLRATNLEVNAIDFNDMVYVPKKLVKEQQFLRIDDIFLAASSGSISVVGKSAQVVKTNGATFGAFCSVIRPKAIRAKFLALWVQSPETREHWSATAKGTNINNLKSRDILDTSVPLPPLSEQQNIVELLEHHLSRLDASIEIADAMEKQSSSLRRSLLQAAFTGQLTKEVASV